jgi:hypothetical protein
MQFEDFQTKETKNPDGIQVLLDFGDYELSIVKNEMSYGNKQGLYEIAVFKGGDQVIMPGITAEHDTVKGYLTTEEVDAIIKKLYSATGTTPRQK